MNVEEFMTTRIETIDADRTVYDALEKMVDRRIRSLLVRFSGNDLEDGVVTARDIVFRVLSRGKEPGDVKVAEIASRPIVCINRSMDIKAAAALMEESKVARVFVCEEGNIIGVLSLVDVMTATLIMRARGNHVF